MSGETIIEVTWPPWVLHPATRGCFATEGGRVGSLVVLWCVGGAAQAAVELVTARWRAPWALRRDRWLRVLRSQTCAVTDASALVGALRDAVGLLGLRVPGSDDAFARGLRLVIVSDADVTLPEPVARLLRDDASARSVVSGLDAPEVWAIRVSAHVPADAPAAPDVPGVRVTALGAVLPELRSAGSRRLADWLRTLAPALATPEGAKSLGTLLRGAPGGQGVIAVALSTDEGARQAEATSIAASLHRICDEERERIEGLRAGEESVDTPLERISVPVRTRRERPTAPPPESATVERAGGGALMTTGWALALGAAALAWSLAYGRLSAWSSGGAASVVALAILGGCVAVLGVYAIVRAVRGYRDEVTRRRRPPVVVETVSWSAPPDLRQALRASRDNLSRVTARARATLAGECSTALKAWQAATGARAGGTSAPTPVLRATPTGDRLILECGPYRSELRCLDVRPEVAGG
ncbi:MAG: hypothetical protein AMXMBFR64_54820 [Myxococcales bacterium]